MTASRCLLYGETSRMHCSGVILAHSSTESSNLEGSVGLFYEIWNLVLIFYWIQVRLGHSSSFIFFLWNQLRVSLAVFGIIVLLKCPPLFRLHHPGTVGVGTEPANINFHWLGAGLLSNYWYISDGVLAFYAFLHLPYFMCSILFPCVIPFYYTYLNFWTYLFCFLCMYGLFGLLPTSGENFKSTAPLELYLLRKMVTCSI